LKEFCGALVQVAEKKGMSPDAVIEQAIAAGGPVSGRLRRRESGVYERLDELVGVVRHRVVHRQMRSSSMMTGLAHHGRIMAAAAVRVGYLHRFGKLQQILRLRPRPPVMMYAAGDTISD
jgi:hypothetical protein